MCFVAPRVSWSQMRMRRVSQLQSLCCVCCGCGCSAWGHSCSLCVRGVGLPSLSMHGVGPPLLSMHSIGLPSQLQSSCHVYCGCRCSVWGHGHSLRMCGMGPPSLSMQCVCRSYGLHAVCVMVVCAPCQVVVVIFVCVAWGHSCSQCGVCVTVAVFTPCVLWWRVRCVGPWSWSSCCMWCMWLQEVVMGQLGGTWCLCHHCGW
jgi:hypothetical protein